MTTFSKQTILSQLSSSYPWKDRFDFFDSIDSTNNRLKILAAQGAPHGTVLVADQQTGGRGRLGRSFLSPSGVGVYMSILLRPKCSPNDLMHLTCATAVAMCDAIEAAVGFRPEIKWTNDLVLKKRKLAGILTELGLKPDGTVDYAIIGIGVNCNQKAEDFSPEIREMAGSLAMISGKATDRSAIAAAMMEALWKLDGNLFSGKEQTMAQYCKDCITIGKEISVVQGDQIRHGTALHVDNAGALVVLFDNGITEAVNSGEVSVRSMYGYV